MSDQAQAQQGEMVKAAAEGQQVLLEEVYVPEFIKSCAERGLEFGSQEDLAEALEGVALLKSANEQESGNLNKEAVSALRNVMGVPQPETLQKQAEDAQHATETARADRVRGALDAMAAVQQ